MSIPAMILTREMIADWRCLGGRHLVQDAVDAVFDLELGLERLDVNVAGTLLDGVGDDHVDQVDQRRLARHLLEVVQVDFLVAAGLALDLLHALDHALDRESVVFLQVMGEVAFARDGESHGPARQEFELGAHLGGQRAGRDAAQIAILAGLRQDAAGLGQRGRDQVLQRGGGGAR